MQDILSTLISPSLLEGESLLKMGIKQNANNLCSSSLLDIYDGHVSAKQRRENTGSKAFKREFLKVKRGKGKKQSLEEAPQWQLVLYSSSAWCIDSLTHFTGSN